MKKKWFLKELLKAHMQSLNFMSPVFLFPPRAGGCQLVHRVWTHSPRVQCPHHFRLPCLAFFVFDAATSSSLRSIAAARSADASWSVSHQFLVLIRSSTSSKKRQCRRGASLLFWVKFIYIADIASLCDMVGMCTGMSSALCSPGLSPRSPFMKLFFSSVVVSFEPISWNHGIMHL